jgi:hypothetical protein
MISAVPNVTVGRLPTGMVAGDPPPCRLTTSTATPMNFATATPAELAAAGFAFKTVRPRRPRKGELICQRVGFKTKRGSQQWRDREAIASPSAYAVVMGNG